MKNLFRGSFALLFALLALLAAAWVAPASATPSYDGCTAFIAPPAGTAVINAPGVYCLDQDITQNRSSTNVLLWVMAEDVTIDCRGHRLQGTNYDASEGVHASVNYRTVVRNCDIRGFSYGVHIDAQYATPDVGGNLVENNRFQDNRIGIDLRATHSMVRGNRIYGSVWGILTWHDVDVVDNIVADVRTSPLWQEGGGIVMYDAEGATISGNRVHGLRDDSGYPLHGIQVRAVSGWSDSAFASIVDNVVVAVAGTPAIGIECDSTRAVARDNVVGGFATGVSGCMDAGDNDSTP
jgi:parallel beta-helix repeat protein